MNSLRQSGKEMNELSTTKETELSVNTKKSFEISLGSGQVTFLFHTFAVNQIILWSPPYVIC